MKRIFSRGFSLVEIAVALAVVAFGLLTVFALLPLGVQSNKISSEETRASMIASMVEADLQNSYPDTGKSKLFGLALPYSVDASGNRSFSTTLPASTVLDSTNSVGLNEAETPVAYNSQPRPRYQVSVIYDTVPAATDLTTLQARIVVSWPALPSPQVTDLTEPGKVSGFVEAIVTFPAP